MNTNKQKMKQLKMAQDTFLAVLVESKKKFLKLKIDQEKRQDAGGIARINMKLRNYGKSKP